MNENKCDAMKKLQTVSFAMDDVRLFLDTHPFETNAIKCYEDYKQQRNSIMQDYEQNYGPVLSYNVNEANNWTWVESPWPWEGEV